MPDSSTPVEVFYCYAHEDEAFCNKLETHLSLLQRQGLITSWHDRHILPGTDWSQAIDEHLERASVILLLISADFLASDYCYGIELQRALQRHQANEASVIPILLRPVDWNSAPFAYLQVPPTNAKPITKWRNRDEAFADVAAGIRRVIEDLSSFQASAPRAALPPVWNVPYPRNSFFIGRDELLTHIQSQLQTGQATTLSQPQAITGLGGIGKTQIAVEYAYRFHQDYQVVLWARAESTEALTSSFITIATLLKLPEHEAQEQTITVQAVKSWLQTHSGWLLLLDNADDLGLVSAFLPPVLGGHLLLTTRAQAMGRVAGRLEVDVFPVEQGALFLLRRGLVADHPESVTTTWSLSFRRVEARNPAAADLLRMCAYLAPDAIAEEIITQGTAHLGPRLALIATDALLLGQMMEALRAYSLIGRDPAAKTLSMHRLVQAVLRDTLDEAERQCWVERAIRAVHAALPALEHANWPQWERLLAHALACSEWIEQLGVHLPAATEVLQQTGSYLTDLARYSEAEPLLERAYRISEQERGAEHLDTARDAFTLAKLYWNQGKYPEAEPLYQRALSICERQLGPEHPNTAACLNSLAGLYESQGRYADAEPLYQRALAIYEQQMEPTHLNMANILNNLARLYYVQGKYEQAEPLLVRALAIREQQLGPEHPHTLIVQGNYVALLRMMGRDAEAVEFETKLMPPS
jgi:tetratricopeptide (TPR) repeat protein